MKNSLKETSSRWESALQMKWNSISNLSVPWTVCQELALLDIPSVDLSSERHFLTWRRSWKISSSPMWVWVRHTWDICTTLTNFLTLACGSWRSGANLNALLSLAWQTPRKQSRLSCSSYRKLLGFSISRTWFWCLLSRTNMYRLTQPEFRCAKRQLMMGHAKAIFIMLWSRISSGTSTTHERYIDWMLISRSATSKDWLFSKDIYRNLDSFIGRTAHIQFLEC